MHDKDKQEFLFSCLVAALGIFAILAYIYFSFGWVPVVFVIAVVFVVTVTLLSANKDSRVVQEAHKEEIPESREESCWIEGVRIK